MLTRESFSLTREHFLLGVESLSFIYESFLLKENVLFENYLKDMLESLPSHLNEEAVQKELNLVN
ncbi:MAG: hypothetical protein JSV88_12930 [Candidatus Aminicenantes bacterium]|nr:MAG: hypothetical protein JSV88_12930 [Candidatus Aminicenantes bacterium]